MGGSWVVGRMASMQNVDSVVQACIETSLAQTRPLGEKRNAAAIIVNRTVLSTIRKLSSVVAKARCMLRWSAARSQVAAPVGTPDIPSASITASINVVVTILLRTCRWFATWMRRAPHKTFGGSAQPRMRIPPFSSHDCHLPLDRLMQIVTANTGGNMQVYRGALKQVPGR